MTVISFYSLIPASLCFLPSNAVLTFSYIFGTQLSALLWLFPRNGRLHWCKMFVDNGMICVVDIFVT